MEESLIAVAANLPFWFYGYLNFFFETFFNTDIKYQ